MNFVTANLARLRFLFPHADLQPPSAAQKWQPAISRRLRESFKLIESLPSARTVTVAYTAAVIILICIARSSLPSVAAQEVGGARLTRCDLGASAVDARGDDGGDKKLPDAWAVDF